MLFLIPSVYLLMTIIVAGFIYGLNIVYTERKKKENKESQEETDVISALTWGLIWPITLIMLAVLILGIEISDKINSNKTEKKE